jgi:hypothetical protein
MALRLRPQLADVAPIHADEVYRTVGAELDETDKRFLKKFGELIRTHFAGRHRELAMLHLTQA